MTAADPFTRACPRWRNAQRLGARSGAAFQVTARDASRVRHVLAVALCGVGFGMWLALLWRLWCVSQ